MKKSRARTRLTAAILVILVLVAIPAGVVAYHAHRTGLSFGEAVRMLVTRAGPRRTGLEDAPDFSLPRRPKIDFLSPRPIGDPAGRGTGHWPLVTHVLAVDLDRDGLLDVVVCDAQTNRVSWIRQAPRGTFEEHPLGEPVAAPAHAAAADVDGDGDLDLLVASLGILPPNNDRIGSVVILENDGAMKFTNRKIIEKIARVSDVEAGDLDGDGDLDLGVAQFGYDDGETRWMENQGDFEFESHMLQTRSGPIHCAVVDMDGDGDLDLVTLVSQEWEEIYVFENDGRGRFTPHLVYGSSNEDFGSSGITISDFDRDGDPDILYVNGDAFDYIPPRPRPWHGVQWLRNEGGFRFTFLRIADYRGATSCRPADVDGDGDLDLLVTSCFNLWTDPEAKSMIWLENDGTMRFARRDLASAPTHLLALDSGDFDGDGDLDFVTGGMHVFPPYDRVARITLWLSRWPGKNGGKEKR